MRLNYEMADNFDSSSCFYFIITYICWSSLGRNTKITHMHSIRRVGQEGFYRDKVHSKIMHILLQCSRASFVVDCLHHRDKFTDAHQSFVCPLLHSPPLLLLIDSSVHCVIPLWMNHVVFLSDNQSILHSVSFSGASCCVCDWVFCFHVSEKILIASFG